MDTGTQLRGSWVSGQSDRLGPGAPVRLCTHAGRDQLATIEFESIPGTTHYLPLEAPDECAAAVIAYLGRHGLLDPARGP